MHVTGCFIFLNHQASFDSSLLWAAVSIFFIAQSVSGGCGGSKKSAKEEDDDCWYELWYFWFIVALFFAGAGIVIAIYCKHHAKHSRLNERDPRVNAQMVMPPAYGVPGHEPPPYHVAMTNTACTPFGSIRTQRAIQPAQSVQPNENVPDANRAISVPPPYSPGQGETRQDHGNASATTHGTVYGDIVDIDLGYPDDYMPYLNTAMPSYFTATNRSAFSRTNISNVSGRSSCQEFECPPAYDYNVPTSQSHFNGLQDSGASRSAARRTTSSLQRTIAQMTQQENMQRETTAYPSRECRANVIVASSYNLHPMSTSNSNQPSASTSRGRTSNSTPVTRMGMHSGQFRSHLSQQRPKNQNTNRVSGDGGGASHSVVSDTTSFNNQLPGQSEQRNQDSSAPTAGPSGISSSTYTNDT